MGNVTKREITVIASEVQEVRGAAVWCAPMQICWDTMRERLCEGRSIKPIDNKSTLVTALNRAHFDADSLPFDHYYAYSGPKTIAARQEIKSEIKYRFGMTGDILKQIEWGTHPKGIKDLLLFSVFFRAFAFPTAFAARRRGPWGNKGTQVTYFTVDGTNFHEQAAIRSQLRPLYYRDKEHHAVRIDTRNGDSIVLVRSPRGRTFAKMWAALQEDSAAVPKVAPQIRSLTSDDSFMCPELRFYAQSCFNRLSGITFLGADGRTYAIGQALQSIEFRLDSKGDDAEIEASIANPDDTSFRPMPNERHFDYDGPFALFLLAKNRGADSKPYLAALVDDMRLFQ